MTELIRPPETSALDDLQRVDPLPDYLTKVWQRRAFAWRMPVEELRSQDSSTVLGGLWQLLNPLLLLGLYYVLFAVGLRAGRGVEHFTTFLAVGIFFFRYTETSAQRGGRSILSNVALVLTARFPRLILPLSAVIASALYLLWGLGAVIVIALLDGVAVRPTMALVPAIFLAQSLLNLGVASALARAVFVVRDLERVLPHAFRVLFYASGVLFPLVGNFSERWYPAFVANPLYAYVSLYRWAILGEELLAGTLLSAALWTIGVAVVGVFFFRAGELDYGRHEF